jgi:hypothetical protein
MCCLFTLRKKTLQGYPILKMVINIAWENVLSVHTEKNKNLLQFLEWDNFEMFVFLSVNRHFLILDLLQFLEQSYPILKIVINLAWENVLSVHTEKNKHFKVSQSKNCNKFSMRKCVVCSHWEKQTLQGYPILNVFLSVNRQHIFSC